MSEEIRNHNRIEMQILDIKTVMDSDNGRRFVWRLLSHCGIYRDVEGIEPVAMSKQIGRRSVGLFLLSLISDVDQDKLFVMMREADADAKEEALLIEREQEEDEPVIPTYEMNVNDIM